MLANPGNAGIGAGLLLLGVPVYLWWRRPGLAAVAEGEGGAAWNRPTPGWP